MVPKYLNTTRPTEFYHSNCRTSVDDVKSIAETWDRRALVDCIRKYRYGDYPADFFVANVTKKMGLMLSNPGVFGIVAPILNYFLKMADVPFKDREYDYCCRCGPDDEDEGDGSVVWCSDVSCGVCEHGTWTCYDCLNNKGLKCDLDDLRECSSCSRMFCADGKCFEKHECKPGLKHFVRTCMRAQTNDLV